MLLSLVTVSGIVTLPFIILSLGIVSGEVPLPFILLSLGTVLGEVTLSYLLISSLHSPRNPHLKKDICFFRG